MDAGSSVLTRFSAPLLPAPRLRCRVLKALVWTMASEVWDIANQALELSAENESQRNIACPPNKRAGGVVQREANLEVPRIARQRRGHSIEFGDQQGTKPVSRKCVLRFSHARIRLERNPADQSEDLAAATAEGKPYAVRQKRSDDARENGGPKIQAASMD